MLHLTKTKKQKQKQINNELSSSNHWQMIRFQERGNVIYKLRTGDSCIYWFMVEEDKKVKFSADAVSYLLDANPVASEESLEKQRDTRRPGREKE